MTRSARLRWRCSLSESSEEGEVSLILRGDDGGLSGAPACARLRAHFDELCAHRQASSIPDEYARAVDAILGDIVVCSSLDEALSLHGRDELGLRFATVEGSCVWPPGKVTLGSVVVEESEGGLARVRRIEELRRELASASEVSASAQSAASRAEDDLRESQAASLDLSQKLATLRGNAEAARPQADRAEEKLASVRRELEDVRRRKADAEAVVADARPSVESFEKQARELQGELERAKAKQEEILASLAPLRRDNHRLSDELAEAKLEAAKLAERDTYTARVRDARKRDLEQLDRSSKESTDLLAAKKASAARLAPLLALFDELSDSSRRWTRDLEDRAAAAQDSSAGLHARVTAARNAARGVHEEFDAQREACRPPAWRREGWSCRSKRRLTSSSTMWACRSSRRSPFPSFEDRAAARGRGVQAQPPYRQLGRDQSRCCPGIRAATERYDYLAGQLADLDRRVNRSPKINRVIDARMKEDFVRTFDAVNDNFRRYSRRCSRAVRPSLSLVDPDDLEDTGVEVNAQPAGKRITKMMLMSGGEKSLTALALLFAVYRTRIDAVLHPRRG